MKTRVDADVSEDAKLYAEAVAVGKHEGRMSCSLLQRRLSIGYARAVGIVQRMEAEGLLGDVITPKVVARKFIGRP